MSVLSSIPKEQLMAPKVTHGDYILLWVKKDAIIEGTWQFAISGNNGQPKTPTKILEEFVYPPPFPRHKGKPCLKCGNEYVAENKPCPNCGEVYKP